MLKNFALSLICLFFSSNTLFCQNQLISYNKFMSGIALFDINNSINSKLLESNVHRIVDDKVLAINLSYFTRPDDFINENDSSFTSMMRESQIYGVSLDIANSNQNYRFYKMSLYTGFNIHILPPIYLNMLLGYHFAKENLIINSLEDSYLDLEEILHKENKSQKLVSEKFLVSFACGVDFVYPINEETLTGTFISNFGIGIQAEYMYGSNYDNFMTNNGAEIHDLESNILEGFNYRMNFIIDFKQIIPFNN